MSAVWAYARASLRRQWRSWLALTVFAALAGGAVLTMAAGARRTDTAYPRFLRAMDAPDVLLFLSVTPQQLDQISHLPEVADFIKASGLAPGETDLVPLVLDDPRLGTSISRFKFLHGRAPRPDRADEILIGFQTARSHHLKVGSPVTIRLLGGGADGSGIQAASFTVVGIEAAPDEFPPRNVVFNSDAVYLSPAFLRTPVGVAAARIQPIVEAVVRLKRGGSQAQAFLADTVRTLNGPTGFEVLADHTTVIQRSMHQQAIALWIMAGFAALAAVLILSQLLVRQLSEEERDGPTLRALGMTAAQASAAGALQLVLVTAGAVTGALAVAIASSGLLPVGTARVAEPHPGLHVDAVVMALGGLAVAALVLGIGAVAILIRHRRPFAPAGPAGGGMSRQPVVAAVASLPLPVVATTGVHLAVQPGRGRTSVPVRATLTAAAVGIAAISTALTFGQSLGHLLATPRLYGVTFDADIEAQGNFADIRPLLPIVRRDASVAASAVGWTGIPLTSRGVTFGAQATEGDAELDPTVVTGRLPVSGEEIVLGVQTARSLHAHLGDSISLTAADVTAPLSMRVVGLGILPSFSQTEQLGRGAVIAPEAIERLKSAAPQGFPFPPPGDIFVRFRPGVDRARAIANLSGSLGGVSAAAVVPALQPQNVANFGQLKHLPQVLAGILAVMAAVATANLLVSSVRRRRRDLAVLKTLGLVPRQVSAVIAWQASTVAVISLLAGLPLGLAAGRWIWTLVARQAGVVVEPVVPWLFLALVVPATAAIVNLVAAGPAFAAGRLSTAPALRAE